MLKPNGFSAKNIDPLILLSMWAHFLENASAPSKKMIFAGIGKPSYFIDETLATTARDYWEEKISCLYQTQQFLQKENLTPEQRCNKIVNAHSAIDYDLPAGCSEARNIMAEALTHWYGSEIGIHPDEIILNTFKNV